MVVDSRKQHTSCTAKSYSTPSRHKGSRQDYEPYHAGRGVANHGCDRGTQPNSQRKAHSTSRSTWRCPWWGGAGGTLAVGVVVVAATSFGGVRGSGGFMSKPLETFHSCVSSLHHNRRRTASHETSVALPRANLPMRLCRLQKANNFVS